MVGNKPVTKTQKIRVLHHISPQMQNPFNANDDVNHHR